MDFNKDMTIEQIIKEMNTSGRSEVTLAVGQAYLQWGLHRDLLKTQNDFQIRQLRQTFWLVIATWTMALTNIILVYYTLR